jgi:hypothetical protein
VPGGGGEPPGLRAGALAEHLLVEWQPGKSWLTDRLVGLALHQLRHLSAAAMPPLDQFANTFSGNRTNPTLPPGLTSPNQFSGSPTPNRMEPRHDNYCQIPQLLSIDGLSRACQSAVTTVLSLQC